MSMPAIKIKTSLSVHKLLHGVYKNHYFINSGGYAEIYVDETNVSIVISFVVKLQVINSQAEHFQLIIYV